MQQNKAETDDPLPWHVPVAVDEIDEAGKHVDLMPDAAIRAAVARLAGLRDLPRFEASFDLARHGLGGLRVAGRIGATVGQTCVITLEPIANEIDETIDLVFMPQVATPEKEALEDGAANEAHEAKWDEPEPLIGGKIDLGALATEFLILAIDPYPRKPGAVFQPPDEAKADGGPFASLAGLRKDRN